MKKSSRVFDVLFFLSLLVWSLLVLRYDITHPDIWCGWKHDPRWYWPLAVVFIPADCLDVWCSRAGLRRHDKRHARLDSTIKIVKELFQGRPLRGGRECLRPLPSHQSGR